MIKCQSYLGKIPKRGKVNDVRWPKFCPMGLWEDAPSEYLKDREVCNGDIDIVIRAVDEPDWGGCYAALEIEYTCSRCNYPFTEWNLVLDKVKSGNSINFNALLKEIIGLKEKK